MDREIKNALRDRVLKSFDYSENISDEDLNDKICGCINMESDRLFLPLEAREKLRDEVFNSIRGFDVLEPLLNDGEVTEIMINGAANSIFVEKRGKILETDLRFESEERLGDIIQQIVSGANRTVTAADPIADARLPDGSRVNVVLPPVALDGPTVTIRKFSKDPLTLEKLTEMGAVTEEAVEALKKLVAARYNIFISGGTGSGKTTFLNALSACIPQDERIITIEDSAELRIENIKNLVRLEVRNKNSGECKEISIRDLIRTALRMRPDRIIVGEVRGAEAIDMLQAMATGHDGSLSTGHGNSVPDMLDRLETMILMGTEIPLTAVRKQISTSIDIVIHLGRLRDGSRKVLEISEIQGMKEGEIRVNPLFVFEEAPKSEEEGKVMGKLKRTGNRLVCDRKLKRAGILWGDNEQA
jgi:pilus assembly protein CpaF